MNPSSRIGGLLLAPFKHYRFIDYATQGYITLVGLLILFFHNPSTPAWSWLLITHGIVLLAVHWLIYRQGISKPPALMEFLRFYYPIPLYIAFYRETGALNQLFHTGYLDPYLIKAELAVFGFHPSLKFMEALPYLPISEILYSSYFSYYIMISGVGLALFLRNRRQFYHYISLVSFTFYVCFLIYIFTPVMGPRIFYRDITEYRLPVESQPADLPDIPEAIKPGPFFQIMAFIYRNFEAPGAAFPSSHVTIAICTVYFSFLYLRRIRYFHLCVAVLLSMATVYCRYHYAIDVLAGMVTASVLIPLGNYLFNKFTPASERPATSE